MTSTSDTDCIVGNEVVPDGSSVNHSTAKDEKNTDGVSSSFISLHVISYVHLLVVPRG